MFKIKKYILITLGLFLSANFFAQASNKKPRIDLDITKQILERYKKCLPSV